MNVVEIAANAHTLSGMNVENCRFAEVEMPVACTPAAVDLAGVGFAAAAFGYLAAKAWYHGHTEDGTVGADGARFPQGTDASLDELVRCRTGALGD